MKHNVIRLTSIFFLAVLTLSPLVRAEPMDRRQLPADTTWFIHVDVDAANGSILGIGTRAIVLSMPEPKKAIEKAREILGVDLTRDVHGVTLYGLSFTPDRAVLILRGKLDRTRLQAMLEKMPGYRTETVGGRAIYFWTEQQPPRRLGAPESGRTQAGTFFGDDAVVIGNDSKAVLAAVDVLEGKAAALPADSPLAAGGPTGTVFWSAAVGIAEAKALPIQSPILRRCESGSLAVGEHGGNAFFHARVTTQSPETATQIRASVEGLRAIAQLQAVQSADLARLLQPLKVSADDKSVTADWEFPSLELVRMIGTWYVKHDAEAQPGDKR